MKLSGKTFNTQKWNLSSYDLARTVAFTCFRPIATALEVFEITKPPPAAFLTLVHMAWFEVMNVVLSITDTVAFPSRKISGR